MKKIIIPIIIFTACVALCAAVWPQSAEDVKVPTDPVEPAIRTEIEAKSEETLSIVLSADNITSEPETVTESEPVKTKEILQEEKTKPASSAKPESQPTSASAQLSSEPKPGAKAVIDGKPSIWIPGFGWIEDHGGGSIGISVDGKGDINKQVGIMGDSTVGNPGDELTGHKVGIMGGGTVAEDMYESDVKIGSMGGEEHPVEKAAPPSAELPEPEGEVIHIVLVETPEKNSTPPDYKLNTTPSAP